MRKARTPGLYTSGEACAVAGLKSTQLLHKYVHLDIVSPVAYCGKHLRWDFKSLVMLKMISRLREAGITIAQIRTIANELANYDEDFANSYLVITDNDVLIVQNDKLVSALRQPGQMMLFVIDLKNTADEVSKILKAA